MGAEEHYVQSWALKEMKCISLVFILFLCFVDILQILAKKKKKKKYLIICEIWYFSFAPLKISEDRYPMFLINSEIFLVDICAETD